jgi:hypothetical protein
MVEAVGIALQVLSWYENLPEDEQPPRHIWWSDKLVGEWFDEVNRKRSEKYGGEKKSSYDTADDVPMMSNEYDTDALRPE